MNTYDWLTIIWTTFFLSAGLGGYVDWRDHRRYCDCESCQEWRMKKKKKSDRLAAEAKKKEFRAP